MDALPPTNRTLDEMDAAARDLGIVPGDPAYAFYTGLRRLYAEQQAILSKILAAAEKQAVGALAARASAELPAAINRAILGRDRLLTAGIVLTVLVLGFGGGVLKGVVAYCCLAATIAGILGFVGGWYAHEGAREPPSVMHGYGSGADAILLMRS
jgi:hypothetical protein